MLCGVFSVGCQTPILVFSGQALSGRVCETESFAFADQFDLLQLEVRPDAPYSVILRVMVRHGELYIDAAERRRWHTYLKQDSRVRVRIGHCIYPATAVRVDNAEITAEFMAGRTIYRIVPRRSTRTG